MQFGMHTTIYVYHMQTAYSSLQYRIIEDEFLNNWPQNKMDDIFEEMHLNMSTAVMQ